MADEPEQVFPQGGGDDRRQRRAPSSAPGRVTGTLGGSATLEGGCVWVDDGSARYDVVWPEGYVAETDPVRLLRDGEIIARAGDRVTVHGRVATDVMTIRQIGPVFQATAVGTGG